MDRKKDGLLDGVEDEDAVPAIAAALVAGALICLAALLLGLV